MADLAGLTNTDMDNIRGLIKNSFEVNEIGLIWADCPPGTRVHDFAKYLYYCHKYELNPLLNEVHLEYRGKEDKRRSSIVVHIDAYRRHAAAHDLIDGCSQTEGSHEELGYFVETTLYKKGCVHPFMARAYYGEYVQTYNGVVTDMWKKKFVMTAKCSEALANRKAGILVGTLSEEEASSGTAYEDPTPVDRSNKYQQPATATTDPLMVTEKPAASAPNVSAANGQVPVSTAPQTATASSAATTQPQAQPAAAAPSAKQVDPKVAAAVAQLTERQYAIYKSMGLEPPTDNKDYKHAGRQAMNEFWIGWFGLSGAREIPRDPTNPKYGEGLAKLELYLSKYGQPGIEALKTKPRELGAALLTQSSQPPAGQTTPPQTAQSAGTVSATPEQIAATVKAKYKWPDDLCLPFSRVAVGWNLEPQDLINVMVKIGFTGKPEQNPDMIGYLRLCLKSRNGFQVVARSKVDGSIVTGKVAAFVANIEASGGPIETMEPSALERFIKQINDDGAVQMPMFPTQGQGDAGLSGFGD